MHRLRPFYEAGFHLRASVMVLPDHTLHRHIMLQEREEGKRVPDDALAEMKCEVDCFMLRGLAMVD